MATPSWQGPLCLVEDKGDAGFQVNASALELLSENDPSLHVVSAIGPAQTGKSYLLNRLAEQHGFRVGHSDPDQPAGLYGWCVPHPNIPGEHILLLDAQGTATLIRGNREQEILTLALATLLADKGTTVFNCQSTISQDGLDLLHSATQTAQLIKDCHSPEAEGASNVPQRHLVWVIRDFYLELSTEDQQFTSDEYLQRVLTSKPGGGAGVQLSNKVRDSIRDYFPTRKCICIPFPSEDKDVLRDLENAPPTQLEEEFLGKVQEFYQYILNNSLENISGKDFTSLLHQYVRIIQSAQISPVLTHTTHALHQAMMAEAASAHLHQPMKREYGASEPIGTSGEWQSGVKVPKMYSGIDIEYEQSRKTDPKVKLKQLRDVLDSLHKDVNKKIREGTYYHPGGVEEYQHDMEVVTKSFWDQVEEDELSKEALHKFEEDHQSSLIILKQTMMKLSPKPPQEPSVESMEDEASPVDETPKFLGKKIQKTPESPQRDQKEQRKPYFARCWRWLTVGFCLGTFLSCGLMYCYMLMISDVSSSMGHLQCLDTSDYCYSMEQSGIYQNIMENKTPSYRFH